MLEIFEFFNINILLNVFKQKWPNSAVNSFGNANLNLKTNKQQTVTKLTKILCPA